jgi:predicted aspartyl protease
MSTNTPYKSQISDLSHFLSEHGFQPIELSRNSAGHLTMKAKINDVEGLFILDTGAGCSVIDAINSDTLKLRLEIDNITNKGAGAGGNMLQVIPSKGNTLIINNIVIEDFTLSVMNLEHVTSAYKQLGITDSFFGILGADLLEPHKAVIDYADMKLWLRIAS